VTIPDGAVCSMLTYDPEEKDFIEISADEKSEYCDKGALAYMPRELTLKENELVGASSIYMNEVESDLDLDFDSDEEDPKEEF